VGWDATERCRAEGYASTSARPPRAHSKKQSCSFLFFLARAIHWGAAKALPVERHFGACEDEPLDASDGILLLSRLGDFCDVPKALGDFKSTQGVCVHTHKRAWRSRGGDHSHSYASSLTTPEIIGAAMMKKE